MDMCDRRDTFQNLVGLVTILDVCCGSNGHVASLPARTCLQFSVARQNGPTMNFRIYIFAGTGGLQLT